MFMKRAKGKGGLSSQIAKAWKYYVPYLDPVEKLRIVYKNGYVHDMWVRNFTIAKHTNIYSWQHVYDKNRILVIKDEEIAALFVVGTKRLIKWKEKLWYPNQKKKKGIQFTK